MKTIPLKTVTMAIDDKKTMQLSYKAQLKVVMSTPQNQTADLNEIRKSLRVLDAIDQAKQTLELEDADFEHMKEKVLETRWPMINREILAFVEDVTNPKE